MACDASPVEWAGVAINGVEARVSEAGEIPAGLLKPVYAQCDEAGSARVTLSALSAAFAVTSTSVERPAIKTDDLPAYSGSSPLLPVGPRAPAVIPQKPELYWSWDRIPTSFQGAKKERAFNDAEVQRLAKYQMLTVSSKLLVLSSSRPTFAALSPHCVRLTNMLCT